MTEKSLSRPPAKVIQEIFTTLSNKTGFPPPSITRQDEIPKEQKQERIDYIQSIIDETSRYLKIQIPCEAKNITAGREVDATLVFLLKLCEAAKITVASASVPAQPEPEPEIKAESDQVPLEQPAPEQQ